jgi:hypothetical protein
MGPCYRETCARNLRLHLQPLDDVPLQAITPTVVREWYAAAVARHLERMSMGDFYGIEPGTIPGFAEAGGGKFIGVEGLPDRTVTNMVAFMKRLHRMYEDDPLAFEVCVRHVASAIEDQRRGEGKADPRDTAS